MWVETLALRPARLSSSTGLFSRGVNVPSISPKGVGISE